MEPDSADRHSVFTTDDGSGSGVMIGVDSSLERYAVLLGISMWIKDDQREIGLGLSLALLYKFKRKINRKYNDILIDVKRDDGNAAAVI